MPVTKTIMPSFADAWVRAGKLAMPAVPIDQQFCFEIDHVWGHPGIRYQPVLRALRRFNKLAQAEVFIAFLDNLLVGKSIAWMRIGISDRREATKFKVIYG